MELLDKYFKVLNDGFISLKDYMGSDEDIEQAARISYGKGTRQTSDTKNLLRYLMRHYHSTPTEMCELKFHIRAPIYVFRQWHRHRTWSYNEYSGRYSEMIDSMEQTKEWRTQSTSNKQGSSGLVENWPNNESVNTFGIAKTPQEYLSFVEEQYQKNSTTVYQERLKFGVAKEQARKDLPVSNYSEMYAKVDLKNLLHFMSLRSDSHAQLEIREYSNIICGIVQQLFPITFEAWYDYSFAASTLSRLDKQMINHIMFYTQEYFIGSRNILSILQLKEIYEENKDIFHETIGMSKRELEEFWNKFDIPEIQSFSLENKELYINNTSGTPV